MAASPRSGELRNATMDTLPVPVARQMIAHDREEMRRRHADDLDAIARELRELGKSMGSSSARADSEAFRDNILARLERIRTTVTKRKKSVRFHPSVKKR